MQEKKRGGRECVHVHAHVSAIHTTVELEYLCGVLGVFGSRKTLNILIRVLCTSISIYSIKAFYVTIELNSRMTIPTKRQNKKTQTEYVMSECVGSC